jgi:phosphoenolpyruvate carboxykinase (diphosphate)
MATRLFRRLPADAPVYTPVDALVPGRRNNPPDPQAGIRSLAVFNPIHYLELPELFAEFISSMTGKSPSTTGAGSEGALTKGPFNALPAIIDLNAALVSQVLTGHAAFLSAAGYVGPKFQVNHDVSLLVPELWCRMSAEERTPGFLRKHGYLEKCEDFEFEGRLVLASRLGYRITAKFGRVFLGRLFTHPHSIFTEEMLQPGEAGSVRSSRTAWTTSAPPTEGRAELLCRRHHRARLPAAQGAPGDHGHGRDAGRPRARGARGPGALHREHLLSSGWYAARLDAKQRGDVALWRRHVGTLEGFSANPANSEVVGRLDLGGRLAAARAEAARVATREYRDCLVGTLGAQPLDSPGGA